ncbi:hypothetical protein SDRG_13510 [Saprolegnia diclina VS20]|uniref:Uncharacterized protein n=1 Tax=Saprolegnia diclina (strain VS20) TaxID=1156394 RepID=T0Q5V8_SAPDV|nr:hypothetical protein SDRG_13510 [Saprolegnia diclina VS20]EQC28830.1 hypothetical protein SDRG_13510 [Saprolegnia diclina VS20]|eukprot:XP_008617825.1 hypothetical protein SDRG_13510 [Saprolegnia diclina VS20]
MVSVAAQVLRAPRMLARICIYQAGAAKMALGNPLRCGAIALGCYADEPPRPDDATVMRSWIMAHGVDGLASLCVPHLFAHAIGNGNVTLLQWLIDHELVMWTKELLVLDAQGCKACPRAVEDLGPAMKMRSRKIVAQAAAMGQLELLDVLVGLGLATNDIWPAVCAGGRVGVAEYVIAHDLGVWDDVCINVAAENGHFELLQYLLDRGYNGVNRKTLTLAVARDHLPTLQDLLAHSRSPNVLLRHALQDAVKCGRLGILRWLCAQPEAWAFLATAKATAAYCCASDAIVQCIRDAMARYADEQRVTSVLVSPILLTIIVAYQAGFDYSTVALHALCSDLALYRNYDRQVPVASAFAVYHETLGRWLARHDLGQLHLLCQPHLFAYAMALGDKNLLTALGPELLVPSRRVELNCRGRRVCACAKNTLGLHVKVSYCGVVEHAAEFGHLDVLTVYHAAGFGMADVWSRVSYFGHMSIAQFAHEHQIPGWQPHFIYNAANAGHHDVIRFFHEHNYDGFNDDTVRGAVHSRQTDLISIFLTHREGAMAKALMAAAETDNVDMLHWLVDQPGVTAAHLDTTAVHAYTTRSYRCAALLAQDPRTSPTLIALYERSLKRKASEISDE